MLPFSPQFLGQVSLAGQSSPRKSGRPVDLGQSAGSYPWREAKFRIRNEEGFDNQIPGKRFPYVITPIAGEPFQFASIKETALSDENSTVTIPVNIGYTPSDKAVDAMLSLYTEYLGTTYPIFVNRRMRFTVPYASALPLDLQAIWVARNAELEKSYANSEIEKAQAQYADEEQLRLAQERVRIATEDAAKKQGAAEEAIDNATGGMASSSKLLVAFGGVAALSLLAYFAFGAPKL